MRIESLDHFGLGICEIVTPKSSIHQLQQQSTIRRTFNEWLIYIHDSAGKFAQTKRNSEPQSGNVPIF